MAPGEALAKKSAADRLVKKGYASFTAEAPVKVTGAGDLDVAFSPHSGCPALAFKAIDSALNALPRQEHYFIESGCH
jgi:hypothetical protein